MINQFIALRYLKGRRKLWFSSSNMLSLLGIFIGVFSLLVVSSVMNGFESDMRDRVIGSRAEIKVYSHDFAPIENYNEITERLSEDFELKSAPVYQTELMMQHRRNIATTFCLGVDYESYQAITDLEERIVIGSPHTDMLKNNGIIIGLSQSVELNATVGEYITLTSPKGTEPTPFGLIPKSRTFRVVGIFVSDIPEYEKAYSYIALEDAWYFAAKDHIATHLELSTGAPQTSQRVAERMQHYLGDDFLVEDWSRFEANLFNAIRMEKIVMFIVLSLIIILAAFNMTGNFIKLVAEKRSNIGILKAMGASEHDIVRVFVSVGLIIGSLAILFGFCASLIVVLLQQHYQFVSIPVPGFAMQWLPVEIRWAEYILIPAIALLISFVSSLYPAYRTVKIDPIKIIRGV